MLDIMRRKKRLKSVLWLVIISLGLGMLLLFVPGSGGGPGGDTSVATVNGESIPAKEFVDTYRRFINNVTGGGKNNIDPATVRALGLHRQALDALVNVRVVAYAAKQLGLDVTDEEVQRSIQTNPNFQNSGVFVGPEVYKAILANNNIGVEEFELGIRSILLREKIRNVVADSLTLSEQEMREEFTRTSQEAQAQFVVFKKDDFKKKVTLPETEVRSYFEANKSKYAIKEQRRVQYLLVSMTDLANSITVSDQDLRAQWEREGRKESVDASHILLNVGDAAKEAEVKARAEALLKRIKAGEDFAELAKKNSEDQSSAPQGGNLGPFQRGRMVKEFEDVAFALKPGEVSGVVRSPFGFHIIKVLRHETPDFESSRKGVERSLQLDRASDLLKKKAAEVAELVKKEKDLNAIGKALGVPVSVKESGFISRDSEPAALGLSPQFIDDVFKIKEVNALGTGADVAAGFALPKLMETRLPRPPEFAEVRANVEKDVTEQKAAEALKAAASSLAAEATREGSLEKAAQKLKLPIKTSLSFKREAVPDPEIGTAPEFNSAAFKLPVGGISDVISTDGGNKALVMQLKSRTPFDEAAYAKERKSIEERLLDPIRESYFQDYIKRITEDLEKAGKIRKNLEAADRLAGATS